MISYKNIPLLKSNNLIKLSLTMRKQLYYRHSNVLCVFFTLITVFSNMINIVILNSSNSSISFTINQTKTIQYTMLNKVKKNGNKNRDIVSK